MNQSSALAESTHIYGSNQLLTFMIGDEEYGVDILCVQEIRAWQETMPIPKAPSFIKGAINIRGEIVPIADLRERLGFDVREYGPMTVVVVVRVESGNASRLIGLVVDAMSDVRNMPDDGLREPPDLGETGNTAFARGIAVLGDKMVIVLNLEELFGPKEHSDEA
ncbi:MAG: chemotaxis protein CheW [Myxococcota bacterium]